MKGLEGAKGASGAKGNRQGRSGRWKSRIPSKEIAENFREVRPPMGEEEARREAERCLYCEYDVPCVRGCPTKIDISKFIRQIAAGKEEDAAMTILRSNIFGNICARVCPVEKLCEEWCICHTLHGKAISIARLQRFATDKLQSKGRLPFQREESTGKRVAVIGAGPAGVSAAFELSRRGHDVFIFEMEKEPGGLDRYGIAEYKVRAPFVKEELNYLMQLGGIEIWCDQEPVGGKRLIRLLDTYDAVLLAVGLGMTRCLSIPGEDLEGVQDAMVFIRDIKTRPLETVPVGEKVLVIGAGNTAVDAGTQARRLGASSVDIAYRRGRGFVKCTNREFELALEDGCHWHFHAVPVEVLGQDGHVTGVRFTNASEQGAQEFVLECDHLIKAIGQIPHGWLEEVEGLDLEANKTVRVDPITWMTSVPGLFAAGDCVKRAKEVVNAVYEGRCAAIAIDGRMARRGTKAR